MADFIVKTETIIDTKNVVKNVAVIDPNYNDTFRPLVAVRKADYHKSGTTSFGYQTIKTSLLDKPMVAIMSKLKKQGFDYVLLHNNTLAESEVKKIKDYADKHDSRDYKQTLGEYVSLPAASVLDIFIDSTRDNEKPFIKLATSVLTEKQKADLPNEHSDLVSALREKMGVIVKQGEKEIQALAKLLDWVVAYDEHTNRYLIDAV